MPLRRKYKNTRFSGKNDIIIEHSEVSVRDADAVELSDLVPYTSYIPPSNCEEALATEAYLASHTVDAECGVIGTLAWVITKANGYELPSAIVEVEPFPIISYPVSNEDFWEMGFPIPRFSINATAMPVNQYVETGAQYAVQSDIGFTIEKFAPDSDYSSEWYEVMYESAESLAEHFTGGEGICINRQLNSIYDELGYQIPTLAVLWQYDSNFTWEMRRVTSEFIRKFFSDPFYDEHNTYAEYQAFGLYLPNWENRVCGLPLNPYVPPAEYLLSGYEGLYCGYADAPRIWSAGGSTPSSGIKSTTLSADTAGGVFYREDYESDVPTFQVRVKDIVTDYGFFSKIGCLEGAFHYTPYLNEDNYWVVDDLFGQSEQWGSVVPMTFIAEGSLPPDNEFTLHLEVISSGNDGVVEDSSSPVSVGTPLCLAMANRMAIYLFVGQDVFDRRAPIDGSINALPGIGAIAAYQGYGVSQVDYEEGSHGYTIVYEIRGQVLASDYRNPALPFFTPTPPPIRYVSVTPVRFALHFEYAVWTSKRSKDSIGDCRAAWQKTRMNHSLDALTREDVANDRHRFHHNVRTNTSLHFPYFTAEGSDVALLRYSHAIKYQPFTTSVAGRLTPNIGYDVIDYLALDDPDHEGHFVMDVVDLPEFPIYQYQPSITIDRTRLQCFFLRNGHLNHAQNVADGYDEPDPDNEGEYISNWERFEVPHDEAFAYAYGDAFVLGGKIYWLGYCQPMEFPQFSWVRSENDTYSYAVKQEDPLVVGTETGYYCQVGTLNEDGTAYDWTEPSIVEFDEAPPNSSPDKNIQFKVVISDHGSLLVTIPRDDEDPAETPTPIIYESAGVLTDNVMPFEKISG